MAPMSHLRHLQGPRAAALRLLAAALRLLRPRLRRQLRLPSPPPEPLLLPQTHQQTWENLFGLDTLAPHTVAKGFLAEYNDAMWEEVVAPFDMTYHNDGKIVKRALATAPVAKCILAVNDAGQVQLVYGLRLCHVVQGQGERILGSCCCTVLSFFQKVKPTLRRNCLTVKVGVCRSSFAKRS